MAIIVTSSRRRLAMAVMLALAVLGSVIRAQAPNPSALRDFGTLLLVMWLPAVGNLVAYVVSKIPRRQPPPTTFAPGAPFTAHLLARIEAEVLPEGWAQRLDAQEQRCTIVVGPRGFTVRSQEPVALWLKDPPPTLALECLVPSAALHELVPGTAFKLAAGSTVVARGVVAEAAPLHRVNSSTYG
ncbi:hypothetical protein [Ramlibacter albus]|uniref:Uncharacterized protein n=1 Tax=Ramlibacter albus TaxID=2079448 RepID=A0A923MAF0_9BURK|nr:hypothetical protein [Ramlibacter albus]MBC5765719.1 hypothetical protein [Ramlibacter albus]